MLGLFFFSCISVEAETKGTRGIYAVFPPKALKIKNELSLAQAPLKLGISIDISAPFHCREWDVIITNVMVTNLVVFTVTVATAEIAQQRTKITCQATHYVHPNPACSILCWVSPDTTLPNALTGCPCGSVSGHRHPPTAHLGSQHQGPEVQRDFGASTENVPHPVRAHALNTGFGESKNLAELAGLSGALCGGG